MSFHRHKFNNQTRVMCHWCILWHMMCVSLCVCVTEAAGYSALCISLLLFMFVSEGKYDLSNSVLWACAYTVTSPCFLCCKVKTAYWGLNSVSWACAHAVLPFFVWKIHIAGDCMMFYEHIVMYTVVLPLFVKQTQQTKNLMELLTSIYVCQASTADWKWNGVYE